MLGYYLDPKNDYAFRRIFADSRREPLLRRFLNGILELEEGEQIERVRTVDRHQVPKLEDYKDTVLDLRCIDQRGREFIVEIQLLDKNDSAQRVLYYVAESPVRQLKKGEKHTKLRKVMLLSILDFASLNSPHYLTTHLILGQKAGEHRLKDFELTFLELTKFHKPESALQTLEDRWIYFFRNAHRTPLRDIPSSLQDPDIEEAFGVLEEIGRSEQQTMLYEKAEMDYRDHLARMDKQFEEGYKQGLIEAKEKRKLETARTMRAEGLNEKTIIRLTGLTLQQLQTLD